MINYLWVINYSVGTLNQFLRGYFWPQIISEFQTYLESYVGTLGQFSTGYFWPRSRFLSWQKQFHFLPQPIEQNPIIWKRNQVHSQAIKRLFNYFQPFTLIRKNLVGWFFCRLHGWGVFAELRLACRTFHFHSQLWKARELPNPKRTGLRIWRQRDNGHSLVSHWSSAKLQNWRPLANWPRRWPWIVIQSSEWTTMGRNEGERLASWFKD